MSGVLGLIAVGFVFLLLIGLGGLIRDIFK